jgi:hypothetical protein
MNKVLTFYSDSHSVLYNDYFLKSYNKYLSKNYTLLTKKIDQLSPSGDWASTGFDKTMMEKVKWIIQNIDLNDNGYLVFADCDVQFFGDLEFDLSSHDILFQHDYYENNYCAGFFICKQNKKVLDFFNLVYDVFNSNMNGKIDDQAIVNNLLNNKSLNLDLAFGTLPHDKYWTIAFSTSGVVWDGQDVNCPDTIIVHHANFTIGTDNKIKLMNEVKKIISDKKTITNK